MDDQVGFKRALLTRSRTSDGQSVSGFFDPDGLAPQLNVGAQFASVLHKLLDQIRIEAWKRTRAPVHDGDLRAGAQRHMGKLEGDVPAADKKYAWRRLVQFEDLFAVRQVLGTRDFQACWLLSCSDEDKTPLQHILAHLNRGCPDEASAAMEGRDTSFGETRFTLLWNWLGEGSLELHQLLPIDVELLSPNSFAMHAACPVCHFRSAHKNLLGIASS